MILSRPELASLYSALDTVVTTGVGTTVFVTGEPGIGKSTLIRQFLDGCDARYDTNVLTATGRCLDVDGMSRGYLPWKEVLIELDADLASGSDVEKKKSLKTLVKTLFDDAGPEWIQIIPNVGEISSAILETARAIKNVESFEMAAGGERELSFRERLKGVAGECTGSWMGAIPVIGGLAEAVFKTSQSLARSRTGTPLKSQQGFFELVGHRLRSLTANHPVITFLDDLQWADPSSIGLFTYLAKNLQDSPHPLLLIGSYRPEDIAQPGKRVGDGEEPERHPLEEKINTLRRYNASTEITLGRLDRDQVEIYLAGRLGAHGLDEHVVDKLYHVTGGNFLFVQEMLANMIEHGLLEEGEAGWRMTGSIDYSSLPVTVEGVIRERYERLADDLRELITTAAVEGEEFALEVIESILQENRIKLHRRLDALINRHAIVRRSTVSYEKLTRIYEFTHSIVQKYVYHSLEVGYRHDLHRVIAETLESLLDEEQLRAWLGPYSYHVGVGWGFIDEERRIVVDEATIERIDNGPERLRTFVRLELAQAADLIESYNNAEALMLCDEVIEFGRVLSDTATLMTAIGKKAGLLQRTGDWKRAKELQHERLRMALEVEAMDEEAHARAGIAWLLNAFGEFEEALAEYERAWELFADLDDAHNAAKTVGAMGSVYRTRGQMERALQCFREQEESCRASGDSAGLASALIHMGMMYDDLGDDARAVEALREGEELSRRIGDRALLKNAAGTLGNYYSARDEFDKALECFEQCLAISHAIGDPTGIAHTTGNMGVIYSRKHDYARSRQCYEKTLRICRDLGNRLGALIAVASIGNLLFKQRDYDGALEYYQRNLSAARELDDTIRIATATGNIGRVYDRQERNAEAMACYMQALEGHRDQAGLRNYWLAGIAAILVRASFQRGSKPYHVTALIPGGASGDWRKEARGIAREYATESRDQGFQHSNSDVVFNSTMTLARIEAAEGNIASARTLLLELLEGGGDDDFLADVHYLLAMPPHMLGGTAQQSESISNGTTLDRAYHRAEALRLYRSVEEIAPSEDVTRRISELSEW